ncbi:sugar ABC transporter ATP-binding protein [Mesorhizobium sp. 113-3-3]|uniref:sugar ABC transporter ATP-binding protein n=1 Tax=Mesorhizobium sp. 113-3-3 TaxID=2744516 RepID=UPI001928689B|nr:sugar ABC transporter ATP-binding protein [Mesorhizobium sp. 113-3-3]
MNSPSLVAEAVSKRFGPTQALDNVSVVFEPGSVHALMGANGSGKSTLTKVLVGLVRPDHGEVRYDVGTSGGVEDRHSAVAAVFQETSLIPDMTVEENVWLTREPKKFWGVDRKLLRQRTEEIVDIFSDVAPTIHPTTLVSDLGPDARQIVELMKALSQSPRYIILDEATASLDARQAARVAELVRKWREQGRSVILVTHRMPEALALADTISVLRNGKLVTTEPRAFVDEQRIVDLMVASHRRPSIATKVSKDIAVDASSLSATIDVGKRGKAFGLTVRKGEIVGLAGLQGQGQSRVLRGLFSGGTGIHDVQIDGRRAEISHPSGAVKLGIALVPGDRNTDGLFGPLPVSENIMISSWRQHGRFGWLNLKSAMAVVQQTIKDLKLKTASPDVSVRTLSGGNAQKAVLARWLATKPQYLLLDDPTKGVDVGARADFYDALYRAKDQSVGILVYSSDEHELEILCDRVLVMHEGELVTALEGADIEAEKIARAGIMGV